MIRRVARYLRSCLIWPSRKIILGAWTSSMPRQQAKIPIAFRQGTEADFIQLDKVAHHYDEQDTDRFLDRLRKGHTLILGLHEQQVVFSTWLMQGAVDLFWDDLEAVPEDSLYSYRVFTMPEYRGFGIAPAYYSYVAQTFSSRGIRRLYCYIDSGNEASVRAHGKAGFQPVGSFWTLVFRGRMRHFVPAATRRRLRSGELGGTA